MLMIVEWVCWKQVESHVAVKSDSLIRLAGDTHFQ